MSQRAKEKGFVERALHQRASSKGATAKAILRIFAPLQ